MGDLEKARRELEEMYLGVPDDSVNLTFGDLSQIHPHSNASFSSSSDKKIKLSNSQNGINSPDISLPKKEEPLPDHPLAKLPSLDFSRAFENTLIENHHHHHNFQQNQHRPQNHAVMDHSFDGHAQHHAYGHGSHRHAMDGHRSHHHGMNEHGGHHQHGHHLGHGGHNHRTSPYGSHQRMHVVGNSMAYDDMSGISMTSAVGPYPGRRRPGIPHSNICTYCSTYIYIFRHRCLVCGRVYCRQCVGVGMGEMPEGRKCVECLGKRFSQRYIHRAGQMGCCMGYPTSVKQQELIWAEKGPRRVVENRQGRSSMVSTSRSPAPLSPVMPHSSSNTPSFMMGSPYSSAHHPLPL